MLRVATFNAGLAVGLLPNVTERVPHVLAALAELDVDLLFVQEFWLDTHWKLLRAALASRLPHVFRPAPSAAPAAAKPCAAGDVAELVACATRHCAGLRDEALARCVVRHCAHLAATMPAPCLNCITADPSGSLDDILARCAGGARASSAARSSSRYGGLVAYGGSHGTALLSRLPLEARDVLVYEATVNARCGLHARIDAPGLGEVHVFATHFSPGGAEHPPQVEALAAWTAEKASDRPALLLGDLNMSPGSSGFRVLARAGFEEPATVDPRATYAAEGLEAGVVREQGWRLDHVLVRGLPAARTERALDGLVALDSGSTTLSDHFAVVATIA